MSQNTTHLFTHSSCLMHFSVKFRLIHQEYHFSWCWTPLQHLVMDRSSVTYQTKTPKFFCVAWCKNILLLQLTPSFRSQSIPFYNADCIISDLNLQLMNCTLVPEPKWKYIHSNKKQSHVQICSMYNDMCLQSKGQVIIPTLDKKDDIKSLCMAQK